MRSLLLCAAVLLACLLALPRATTPRPRGPAAAGAGKTARAPHGAPGLLLVLADDLGIEALALSGLDPELSPGLTPNLDALAARGVLFTQAWANPLCSPTRATLLTGSLPSRTGIGNVIESAAHSLPEESVTIPEMLREHGPHDVRTAAFGKWHLEHRASARDSAATELHGFDHFDGHRRQIGPDYQAWPRVAGGAPPRTETRYATDCLFAAAATWIASQDRSWFCYLAPEAPYHYPHLPPEPGESLERCARTDRACWERLLAAFDARLGELIESLGPGWEAHTTIVFVGDNGTPNNVSRYWPAGRAKGTPYEGGLRVPLIVAGRAVDPARRGARSDELVYVGDLFRTAASALGVADLPGHVGPDSFDLSPALRHPPAAVGRTHLIAERFKPNAEAAPFQEHLVMVRDRRFKLIWDETQRRPQGLYDLARDPLEARDLLAQPELSVESAEALRDLRVVAQTRSVSDSWYHQLSRSQSGSWRRDQQRAVVR